MKRLERDPEKFDVLELFSSMGIKHDYDLSDPESQKDFLSRVHSSFEASKANDVAIYGKRTESLFAYVVGGLGKTALLKKEDAGELYHIGEDLLPPDYRAVLKSGEQILIEVKNCHFKNLGNEFSIKKDYYYKLNRYSDICSCPLKFAIYLSAWNLWALVSIDNFLEHKNSYTISLAKALACSEMAFLGDCAVGTAPNLELHLLADPREANEVDGSGCAEFTARDVKIYCAGQEVIDQNEKRIALFLMRYGDWQEESAEGIIEQGRLSGLKFVYMPQHQEEPNFALVGQLSSMISTGFRELTMNSKGVKSLSIGLNPSVFEIIIPENYKGKNLPLWRFVLTPNPDFSGVDKQRSG